jgi:hypothetical protein
MTLLSKASFLVTPNGYKEDKLYAAIPTNGNGDMTVTRATTATRVNEAGLVELVPYNLLSRSEEFDNASWNKTQVNVTANALTAPNGTLTADFLIPTAVSSTHTISQAASGTATFTIFAKQGGYKRFRLLTNTSGNGYASFNLETGLVTTASGTYYVSSGIEDFGNGWYRCRLVLSGAEATFTVAMEDASGFSGAWTGDGTSGIYFWGAQVVEGTSALTYQKTVDRLDIPRIDYTGGGCPSILLEPQRTNLVTYSEDFSNASWSKGDSTIVVNSTMSPSNILNATLLNDNSVNAAHSVNKPISVSSGLSYNLSIYAKKKDLDYIAIGTVGMGTGYSYFNISNGTLGSALPSHTLSISNAGNGWYKCKISGISTGTSILFVIALAKINNGVNYSGTVQGNYIWGAQVEAGAYPTSYIPTTTASVTRLVDSCHLLNHSLFTDYPFTVYGNSKIDAVGNTIFSLNNTSSPTYYLAFNFANSIQVGLARRDLSNNDSDFYNFSYSAGDTIKVAVAFISPTAYKLYINGTEIANVTSGTSIPFNHNDISLGQFRITSDTGARNSINEFMVFNEVLSDSELQTLTTL